MDLFNAETRAEELLRLYDIHEDFLAFDDNASSNSHSRTYIPREYAAAEQRLLNDYFGDNPKYPERNFRRRYRMSRQLFLKIVKDLLITTTWDEMERNKMLLVDPECNCRLVDVDTGFYSWLIEFNKPLVYEYHQPNAKDYLTIAGTKYGTMNIFRQRQHTKGEELSSEIVCCDKEEDIQVLLNGEKCLTSSESIYVNGKSGEIGQKSEDTFLVVRKTYQMKSYSRRHLETRLLWQLNFSSFEAFYPSNKEVCDPVKVFHTVNQHDFYEFCKDFNVKNQSNTPLLEILKWKLQPNEKSSIKLYEKRVGLSKMRYGEFEAVTVGVEELKANGHFSKHVNNLRNLGVHENILDFIIAETNGMSDMFAYQIMFTTSLKDYVASMCNTTNNWRTMCEWIKVLSLLLNSQCIQLLLEGASSVCLRNGDINGAVFVGRVTGGILDLHEKKSNVNVHNVSYPTRSINELEF